MDAALELALPAARGAKVGAIGSSNLDEEIFRS